MAAEFLGGDQPGLRQNLFFLSRSRLVEIDGWKEAVIRDVAIQDKLAISSAFEFLENHLIHTAARVDERRCHDRKAATVFQVACRTKEFARKFERAAAHATR